MHVLITSIGTATSVGLVKSFRRHYPDFRIFGVDVNPFGLTAGSQLVDGFCQVCYASDDGYVDEIASIIENNKIDLIIPINDVEVDVISRCRDILPSFCSCIVPGPRIVDLCRDKMLATCHVQSMGIDCPELLGVGSGGPRICRDRVSVGSKGIVFFEEGEPLSGEAMASIASGQSFLQRRVFGQEYTVDVLSDAHGEPIFVIPRERVEVKAGVATKTCIEENDALIEATARIVRSLSLPGFSNVQFIVGEDSTPYFIEINPRFGGCAIASLLAAPDMFPAFVDIASGCCDAARGLNEGVRWGSVVTRYYEEVLYERES